MGGKVVLDERPDIVGIVVYSELTAIGLQRRHR